MMNYFKKFLKFTSSSKNKYSTNDSLPITINNIEEKEPNDILFEDEADFEQFYVNHKYYHKKIIDNNNLINIAMKNVVAKLKVFTLIL